MAPKRRSKIVNPPPSDSELAEEEEESVPKAAQTPLKSQSTEGFGSDSEEEFPRLSKAIERLSKGIEWEASTYVGAPKDAKKIISSLGKEKARQLEEGWSAIRVKECEFYAKRSNMIFKQRQAMLDAEKSSNLAGNVLVSDSSSNVGDNDSPPSG